MKFDIRVIAICLILCASSLSGCVKDEQTRQAPPG
ncbi:uncharacterized protein METZ01_LOCUS329584, partial [marine metagenome]